MSVTLTCFSVFSVGQQIVLRIFSVLSVVLLASEKPKEVSVPASIKLNSFNNRSMNKTPDYGKDTLFYCEGRGSYKLSVTLGNNFIILCDSVCTDSY
jgi:hypothetical protein